MVRTKQASPQRSPSPDSDASSSSSRESCFTSQAMERGSVGEEEGSLKKKQTARKSTSVPFSKKIERQKNTIDLAPAFMKKTSKADVKAPKAAKKAEAAEKDCNTAKIAPKAPKGARKAPEKALKKTAREAGLEESRPRKRHRPGVRALRDIRKYQKSTSLLIPNLPFSRLSASIRAQTSAPFISPTPAPAQAGSGGGHQHSWRDSGLGAKVPGGCSPGPAGGVRGLPGDTA